MEFSSSAPCKCILFGEHYAVYGAPAVALAIEPRNVVAFSKGAQKEGIGMFSPFGKGAISPSGKFSGAVELALFEAVARKAAGGRKLPDCTAEFLSAWKLKGVGTSASLCAAFACGIARLCGRKPDAAALFDAAQAGDFVAHSGKASGIDARTVCEGGTIVFRRGFSPPRFDFARLKLAFPPGCSLFLVDTNVGKRDGTGKMVDRFGKSFGIRSAPKEAGDAARERVLAEYAPLWLKAEKWLKKPSAAVLGSLMDENHALLLGRGMSSRGIERAVAAAKKNGALGAKITGAGGEGGAALVLCNKGNVRALVGKVRDETGFACHGITLADAGARVDAD